MARALCVEENHYKWYNMPNRNWQGVRFLGNNLYMLKVNIRQRRKRVLSKNGQNTLLIRVSEGWQG